MGNAAQALSLRKHEKVCRKTVIGRLTASEAAATLAASGRKLRPGWRPSILGK
jgi:hypothetical protein